MNMQVRYTLLAGLLVLGLLSNAQAQVGAKLQEEGDFTVDCPRPDFGWAIIKEGGKDTTKVRIYACGKKDLEYGVLLTVDSRAATTEQQRRKIVTAHYNTLIESLQQDGYTNLRARQPKVDGQVADRVGFDIEGKNKQGKLEYIYVETVFGRAVYTFQAVGGTDPEARKLIAVAGSLKELR